MCWPPPSSCWNASSSHISGLPGCPPSRISCRTRNLEKSTRTGSAFLFSSYQQVEGGAASDGDGFDRPQSSRVSYSAGRNVCWQLPRTLILILPGGDMVPFSKGPSSFAFRSPCPHCLAGVIIGSIALILLLSSALKRFPKKASSPGYYPSVIKLFNAI